MRHIQSYIIDGYTARRKIVKHTNIFFDKNLYQTMNYIEVKIRENIYKKYIL